MARIRTLKPEMLSDEKTATLTDAEFRLFVGIILLADDYGNLRANPKQLDAAIFWARENPVDIGPLLETLTAVGLIVPYTVRGQRYIHLRGWDKHQKVDHPGKPLCPGLAETDTNNSRTPRGSLANTSGEIPESFAPEEESERNSILLLARLSPAQPRTPWWEPWRTESSAQRRSSLRYSRLPPRRRWTSSVGNSLSVPRIPGNYAVG